MADEGRMVIRIRNRRKFSMPESEEYTALSALFQTACLCNNATLVQSTDASVVEGHGEHFGTAYGIGAGGSRKSVA
jgi:hypothetical protein